MSDLKFVFVHGLSGWGSYDEKYKRLPYWGMRGGDLMERLRGEGFSCYAASVDPSGSAWDRACELYAQIAGTRTDYGAAHAALFGHERFGKDFSDKPLVPGFDESAKLVLVGHSFGGATIRLFAHLMSEGSIEEKNASPETELSPFFVGGHGDAIHALVTIAAPHNGTTAYDMLEDSSFDPEKVKVPWWSNAAARMMSRRVKAAADGRDETDYAAFDMHIDNADALNRRLKVPPFTYCFSFPCRFTKSDGTGNQVPKKKMEELFVKRSYQMGAYAGTTRGGIITDDSWKENDGLVNTVSAMAPSHAPAKEFDKKNIEPGIWQVMPTVDGDHMALQGGLVHRHEVYSFHRKLLAMISRLKQESSEKGGNV